MAAVDLARVGKAILLDENRIPTPHFAKNTIIEPAFSALQFTHDVINPGQPDPRYTYANAVKRYSDRQR
jgi:hypothetical protein